MESDQILYLNSKQQLEMVKNKATIIIPDEVIISKIYFIRGQKVMIDKDLAELYNVLTGNLNKAVKRNAKRFPKDFMFQLNEKEFKSLMFQNGISNRGGTRKMPFVFTEQGVAMLSSVLNSDRAIEVNIRIIRIFTKIRQVLSVHKDILIKLEHLEKQVLQNNDDIQSIFIALRQLIEEPEPPREPIGFKIGKSK